MMRTMMKGLGLAAAVLAVGGASASADTIYGITDSNQLFQLDTTAPGSATVLANVGAPVSGNSNGLALDGSGRYLLFRNGESGSLRSYDLATNTLSTLTGASLPGSTASGSFYGGYYWYVQNGTNDLMRVGVDLATSTITGVTAFDFGSGNYGFGDIAIAADGTLYASSNRGFFTMSVAGGSLVAGSYNMLNPSGNMVQIALLSTGGLIGQDHDTGQWYNISSAGVYSSPLAGYDTTYHARDLAGQAVPEPSSIAMMGLGGLSALAFGRRRLRKAA